MRLIPRTIPGLRRPWRSVALLAASALGCTGLAALAAAPASAAAACQVSYSTPSDWGSGFTAAITITNTGSAISSWTLAYSYAGNQTLTSGWSGTWAQSGKDVTVTSASWNGSLATGGTASIGANFNNSGANAAPTAFTLNGTACNGSGSPSPTPTPTGSPSPTPTPTTSPTPSPTPSPTGSSGTGGGSILVDPANFSVAAGNSDVFGVSLASAPTGNITVNVARTAGNTGLSVSAGTTLTFTTSNWQYPQPVTIAAAAGSTGNATFTASSTGLPSVTTTGTETAAGSTTTPSHVVNPFTGSTWYVNPDYTAEVATSAANASGTLAAQMKVVGQQSTSVWLDHIGAIYGGSDNSSRRSLESVLQGALSQESGSTPIIVPIVVYDLPNRDCAALASNGELSISNNGLQYYEQDYINPIAQILTDFEHTNIRVEAVIEPDSLPNLVTNTNIASCSQAQSSGAYVSGVQYALSKLHAIPNVYNYVDIAHSGWLGWPTNMTPAVSLLHQVAAGTTAGTASVDGFISDTANTIPVTEPFMTATQSVGGTPIDQVQYYSFDPYIDELTYDEAFYQNLVNAGFSSNIGMLIDTSRDGWGGPNRPTGPSTSTNAVTFVNQSKIDQRPFRGDWCNPENAGIGNFPQANPNSSFSHLYAYVWVKPPGESDGTYPAFSGKGDPHCDPNGTQTDGSGNSYPTDAIPDSPPAGNWFPTQFTQLVQNANPAIP